MKVKQKISELIDALHTENAELHRKNRELKEENLNLHAELFHLRGKAQSAFTPNELEAPDAVHSDGLSFDAASNHARNLIRELDTSKYQIGECLFVDAREGITGNPISIITKEPANEG